MQLICSRSNFRKQFLCFSDIEYLKTTLPPTIEQSFFTYLKKLTAKDVKLYAIDEGSVVFPR